MRRLITFPCAGATLVGSFDHAGDGARHGVLLVTGGRETRFGSHRLYERLAVALAGAGLHAFRFDRRGCGDSDGDDPGFRASAPDIAAALAAFRAACPEMTSVAGFGLCDGASALALHAGDLDLAALVLANPWLVEPIDDLPPAAAIQRHYARAILDPATWRRALAGGIDLGKAARGVARLLHAQEDQALAVEVLDALARRNTPTTIVIAEGDNTGAAALAAIEARGRATLPGVSVRTVATASHSFAGAADFAALAEAVRAVAGRMQGLD
jgi:exosortase A-associated hydrolase 1